MKSVRGFTLVELLIVLFFVAIAIAGSSIAYLAIKALLKYISS